jgi:tryptophan halogenase
LRFGRPFGHGNGIVKRRVKEIVIVGADAPAWMAACAIQLSLGVLGVRVRVIELPSTLQPVDVYSVLPTLAGLHHRIGLEEQLLFRACGAVPTMGQRFSNWSEAGPPFIHGYDRPYPSGAGLGFTQLWIKGRQNGLRTEFDNFSLGAMAAKAGRVPVVAEGDELSSSFGYTIDAGSYSALLRRFAIQCGVESKAGSLSNTEVEGDRITAVNLADGERIEADLFIDASGPQGHLISQMPQAEFESWREWLPCDRMLVTSGKALRPYPGFSEVSAFRAGWIALFPLQDRTTVVAAYDSREISDQEVVDSLPTLAKLPIGGEAVVSAIAQGMRRRAWVGNCVAVGESAFFLEPLDAVQLHIAHYCISHLMTLFPVESGAFPEAELYNRIVRGVATNLRDFQIVHYKLNRRFGEPMWDRCRESDVPDSLQRKLDLFAARGRVALYDDETFQEEGWESLFIGHGLMPQSYDPRVDAMPEQQQIAGVHSRLENIVGQIGAMPSVDEFLASSSPEHAAEGSA